MKIKTFLALTLVASFAANPVFGASFAITDLSVGKNNTDEFIVLSNASDTPFPLDGFRMTQAKSPSCSDETLVTASRFSGKSIPAGGTLLIAHPDYTGTGIVDISYASSYSLTTSTVRVILFDGSGSEVAKYKINTKCDPVPETPPEEPDNDTPPKPTTPVSVRLNEVFPNPKAKSDTGEFIELYNAGTNSADISGWILRDATKTGKYVFPAGTTILGSGYLAVTDQSFKLSLNNSNETISLHDKQDILIDSMRYEKTKEDISLNSTPAGWRGGTPTPGTANILNSLPETKEKVPKKGYKGMPVAMTAKGKDADKDKLKYTWDFGDSHKSYKQETAHTYEKNGNYTVTLTVTDGSDDVIETFEIKITSYDPPDIRIVSFIPNPDGKDTDSEWILIENRGKKKPADLKGFGIATGWKKLANHPVRESFIVPPKSSAKLTREYSLFTLPNEKGKIELRAPDGEVLQEIKYKLEKSAPEDAVYTKKKGERWKLTASQQSTKNSQRGAASSQQETETVDETQTPENEISEPDTQPAPVEEVPPVPDEEKEIPQSETPSPSVIIHDDAMTKDPDQPELSDLLSYGLSLHLPKAIAYVPSEQVPVTPAVVASETEEISVDDFFTRINAHINAWLNGI